MPCTDYLPSSTQERVLDGGVQVENRCRTIYIESAGMQDSVGIFRWHLYSTVPISSHLLTDQLTVSFNMFIKSLSLWACSLLLHSVYSAPVYSIDNAVKLQTSLSKRTISGPEIGGVNFPGMPQHMWSRIVWLTSNRSFDPPSKWRLVCLCNSNDRQQHPCPARYIKRLRKLGHGLQQ